MKQKELNALQHMKKQESTNPIEVLHTQQVTTLSQQKQSA